MVNKFQAYYYPDNDKITFTMVTKKRKSVMEDTNLNLPDNTPVGSIFSKK